MRKILLFILLATSLGYAQNNGLDQGFGSDGVVSIDLGLNSNDIAYDAVLSGGGILMVGSTENLEPQGVLARFANGALDLAFGNGGKVFFANAKVANDIKLLSDGKIAVAGMSNTGVFVARLNANGSLDTSFGTNGYYRFYANQPESHAVNVDMALSDDGSIFLTGTISIAGTNNTNFYIVKLTTDGSPDATFDGDGVLYSAAGSLSRTSHTIIVQPDGKPVISGSFVSGPYSDWLVARYSATGAPDLTFNTTGIKSISFFDNPEEAKCLVLQPDGKIVIGGNTTSDNDPTTFFALARLTPDGQFDLSFSSDGRAFSGYSYENASATSILLDAEGSVYLGGYSNRNGSFDYQILKYLANGVRDNGFGTNGFLFPGNSTTDQIGNFLAWDMTTTPPSLVIGGGSSNKFHAINTSQIALIAPVSLAEGIGEGRDIDYLSDGTYITSGYVYDSENWQNRFYITKLLANGDLDSSFSGDGKIMLDHDGMESYEVRHVVQPDGKTVIAAGNLIARLLPNGVADETFGDMGKVVMDPFDFFSHDVGVDSNGKILMAGHTTPFAMKRLNADGTPDTTFGENGDLHFGFNGHAEKFTFQPDGKILVSGFAYDPDHFMDSVIARVDANGSLDATFGQDGIVTLAQEGDDTIPTFELLPDGKILVAVVNYENGTDLIRLNANGSIDSGFGNSGVVTGLPSVSSSALDNDGRLILAGARIRRFSTDGIPDLLFGNAGEISINEYGNEFGMTAKTIKVQPDDKIIAIGGTEVYKILRFLPDSNMGTIDFEKNESYIYPNPVQNETTFSYELSRSEKITVALYDLSGKLLKNYVSGEVKPKGKHDLIIAMPNGISAGHYILKISSDAGSNSVKLIKK